MVETHNCVSTATGQQNSRKQKPGLSNQHVNQFWDEALPLSTQKVATTGRKWQKVAESGNLLKNAETHNQYTFQPKNKTQNCHFYEKLPLFKLRPRHSPKTTIPSHGGHCRRKAIQTTL